MNLYDILIGLIIGVGLERATKISFALQKMIKEIKQKQKEERARKKALINNEYGAALVKSEEQK